MHRSYGRLMLLTLVLFFAFLLLMPMHTTESTTIERKRLRMTEGETRMIGYTDERGQLRDVRYSVDRSDVLSVSADGMLTARQPGTAVVTVTEGRTDMAVLTVNVGARSGKVTLSVAQLSLNKGEVSALKADVVGDDDRLVWSSSDPGVASVDNEGRVVAVSTGSATVTATAVGGESASARVDVHVTATAVALSPVDVRAGVGARIALDRVFTPEDATDTSGHWESEDPDVVKMHADGSFTAVGAGHTVVHFTTAAGLTAQAGVTVEDTVAPLTALDKSMTMERGSTCTLDAGQNATDHLAQWHSSNPAAATVENGVVTALASGRTNITVTMDGQTSTCALTVITSVQSVTLDVTELYLLREQTDEPIRLNATLTPADADRTELVFSTDNALVAYAAQDGTVTLTGAYGSAVITATAPSGAMATCTINVVTELPEAQTDAPDA